jgi:hypothetical protein
MAPPKVVEKAVDTRLSRREKKQLLDGADSEVSAEEVSDGAPVVEQQDEQPIDEGDSVALAGTASASTEKTPRKRRTREEKELDQQIEEHELQVRIARRKLNLQSLQQEKAQLEQALQAGATHSGSPQSPEPLPVNPENIPHPQPTRAATDTVSSVIDQVAQAAVPIAAVVQPPSATNQSANQAAASSILPPPPVTLATVRSDPVAQQQVKQQVRVLGFETAPELVIDATGSVRGKQPVSGRVSKVECSIVREIKWPHSKQDHKFVHHSLTYEALDFPLLIAGELAIIRDPNTCVEEANLRTKLIRELCYGVRVSQWHNIKQFHAAVLTEIERGTPYSDISLTELSVTILAAQASLQASQSAVTRQAPENQWTGANSNRRGRKRQFNNIQDNKALSTNNQEETHRFCSNFNQGLCPYPNDHTGMLNGKSTLLEHICAPCWIYAKEANRHNEKNCDKYKPRM